MAINHRYFYFLCFLFFAFLFFGFGRVSVIPDPTHKGVEKKALILNPNNYEDSHLTSVAQKLFYRIKKQPFNVVSLAVFLGAIIHTLLSHKITQLAHKRVKKRNEEKIKNGEDLKEELYPGVVTEILYFLGEVEVIFGLWVIPLLFFMSLFYSWEVAGSFLDSRNYVDPIFVIVVMSLVSTTPIISFAEKSLHFVASLGGSTPKAWWFTILTIAPLLGSFITEPAAMTLAAILLSRHFYQHKPTKTFAYATLGLLFTNISVGGVLTNFAAPPVLMVAKTWGWDISYMFNMFGWKAIVGILIANVVYFVVFRKHFEKLEVVEEAKQEGSSLEMPTWITVTHLIVLCWIIFNFHYPAVFIGSFLVFLGFRKAIEEYTPEVSFRTPILVGFFLAGLIVHGSLQAWWISLIFEGLSEPFVFGATIITTAFNDNAAITFLASNVPDLSEQMKYVVVSGAVIGGGTTIMANAPNPAGYAILEPFFKDRISALGLFFSALTPTIIMIICFWAL